MALKMTNEVSRMDVFAIGGLVLGGAGVFFGLGADVQMQGVQIVANTESIHRVERQAQGNNDRVLDLLKQQTVEMKEIRAESEAGRIRIENKLDKIIDRALDGK